MTRLRIAYLTLLAGGLLFILLAVGAVMLAFRAPPPPEISPLDLAMPRMSATAPPARISLPAAAAKRFALPDGSQETVNSLLNIDAKMRYGEFKWDEAGVPDGPVWIRVDLSRQMLSVFRAGHEIGAAVILYGAKDNPTPAGLFPIIAKAQVHRSSSYDADMPYMLRLTGDGIAIHATDVRGGFASRGCVGVPTEFARKLFAATKVGDRVAILPEQPRT